MIDPLHGARFAVKLVEKPHKRLNRKQRGLWTSRVRATRKLLIYIVKQLTKNFDGVDKMGKRILEVAGDSRIPPHI